MNLQQPAKYGKRAAAASHRRAAVFCISGESVTARQIGERLGVSIDTARNRLAAAQKADGPVTWESMTP